MRAFIRASAHAIPLADETVQTVVTSPPYWGLRKYAGEQAFVWDGDVACGHSWGPERVRKSSADTGTGIAGTPRPGNDYTASSGAFCDCGAWRGALGLEPTPELYVEHMVDVFREVRRVLRPDGTLWLNLGDTYNAGGTGKGGPATDADKKTATVGALLSGAQRHAPGVPTLKPKDMIGIPWRVAFALQADGWYLRSDIIWAKPNPMPESVTDRPTKAHEYLFLLTKSQRYYYDADAIREPHSSDVNGTNTGTVTQSDLARPKHGDDPTMRTRPGSRPADYFGHANGRNARTVWTVATQPYPGAHFATFPEKLIEPCILAGSARGDLVLDPFNGSGTTGRVAIRHGREYVGLDISHEYLHEQATQRVDKIQHTMGI